MFSETVSRLLKPGTTDEKRSRSPTPAGTPAGTRTPVQDVIRNFKSYISTVTTFKNGRAFEARPSIFRKRVIENVVNKEGLVGAELNVGSAFEVCQIMWN
jgi:hypothetical protein